MDVKQYIGIVLHCSSNTFARQSPGYFEPVEKHQQDTELKASTMSPGCYHSWSLSCFKAIRFFMDFIFLFGSCGMSNVLFFSAAAS